MAPDQVLDLVKALSSMMGPIQCGHPEIDLLATLLFDARYCLVHKNFSAAMDGINVALDTVAELQDKFRKEGKL